MRAARDPLQQGGARRLTLGTVAENATVTAFYSSLGYRIAETRPVPLRGFTAHTWEKVTED